MVECVPHNTLVVTKMTHQLVGRAKLIEGAVVRMQMGGLTDWPGRAKRYATDYLTMQLLPVSLV